MDQTHELDETRPDAVQELDAFDPTSSRRKMLRNVAAGVATIGAASIVTSTRTARAADNDPLSVGATTEHTLQTNVNYKGPTSAVAFNVQSGDETAGNNTILNNAFASIGTAFLGVASGNGTQGIGVTGWSKRPLGTGVVGFTGGAGAYGGEFFGGLAEVRLRPGGAAPITLTNAHQVGEMYEDETGTLWICVVAGTPGSWREVAAPSSAGSFHAITPRRVYDSRNESKLAPTVDRVVSVATGIDGTPDVVPVKSSAVALTVTVTETSGNGGFVAVRPAATVYNGTSSINWFGPNQNLATTVITGLDADRQITLRAGSDFTHVIVDVTGFYR